MEAGDVRTYWFGEGTNVFVTAPTGDVENYNEYRKRLGKGETKGDILEERHLHESYILVCSLIGKAVFELDQAGVPVEKGKNHAILVEYIQPEEVKKD